MEKRVIDKRTDRSSSKYKMKYTSLELRNFKHVNVKYRCVSLVGILGNIRMVRLGIVRLHSCLHIVVIKPTDQNRSWDILLLDYLLSYKQVYDCAVVIRCGSLKMPWPRMLLDEFHGV
jgi:hypothetical protein